MPKRGPQQTPNEILNARGSWRGKARERDGSPKPESALPECPDWVLSDNARKHWKSIGEYLLSLKIVATCDQIMLGMLVDALGDYIELCKQAKGKPGTVTNAKGSITANPIYRVKAEAWARLRQALQEFGLTPAARGGVKVLTGDAGEETPQGKARFFKVG